MTPDDHAVREMLSDELVEALENLHQYPRLIAERAASEAVAAERQRIWEAIDAEPTIDGRIHRDRIRAIIGGEK